MKNSLNFAERNRVVKAANAGNTPENTAQSLNAALGVVLKFWPLPLEKPKAPKSKEVSSD